MPWKECSAVEERLRFVARLLEGEAMCDLACEFGISRKTGYKILNRYKTHGIEALTDRSRRPWRYANQLPLQVESLIVRTKREKPHWGARKIRELLVERLMRRSGLRARPRRRRLPPDLGDRQTLTQAQNVLERRFEAAAPNRKWMADFTYVWTAEGWLYVAAVLDLFSRRVVGWSMSAAMTSELVTDALVMAIWRRGRGLPLIAIPGIKLESGR